MNNSLKRSTGSYNLATIATTVTVIDYSELVTSNGTLAARRFKANPDGFKKPPIEEITSEEEDDSRVGGVSIVKDVLNPVEICSFRELLGSDSTLASRRFKRNPRLFIRTRRVTFKQSKPVAPRELSTPVVRRLFGNERRFF